MFVPLSWKLFVVHLLFHNVMLTNNSPSLSAVLISSCAPSNDQSYNFSFINEALVYKMSFNVKIRSVVDASQQLHLSCGSYHSNLKFRFPGDVELQLSSCQTLIATLQYLIM